MNKIIYLFSIVFLLCSCSNAEENITNQTEVIVDDNTEKLNPTSTDCSYNQESNNCIILKDFVKLSTNNLYTICSNEPFNINGVNVYSKDFCLFEKATNKLLFNSDKAFSYNINSVNDTLTIAEEISCYELNKIPSRSTASSPQKIHIYRYYFDENAQSSIYSKEFRFMFKKVTNSTINKLQSEFEQEISKMKSDVSYKFSFNVQIHRLFICAFNGDKKAIEILNNLEQHIEIKYLNQLYPLKFEFEKLNSYKEISEFSNTLMLLNLYSKNKNQ